LKEQILARRYARALFAIGEDNGEYKKYGEELAAIAEVLDYNPKILQVFKNPIIRTEDKKDIVKKLTDKIQASKIVQNFCLLLGDKERLGNFLSIQKYYNKLLDQKEGLLRGKLVTAIELSSEKQNDIRSKLEEKFAQSLILEHEKNDSILGGLVLQVGDKVYDASLKAQLDRLKENIKRGE